MPQKISQSKKWRLTKGILLYKWQEDCISSWFDAGCKGTVKVVTGAGKTLLGLAIAERLHNDHDSDLRIAIVVPTIVLLNQWYDEILDRTNLPESSIGRLGGGYKDEFSNDIKILICVLVSASKKLPELVQQSKIGENLLFIADECHRTGAAQMSRVLTVPRKYSLGLSATPERTEDEEDDVPQNYNESKLALELGSLVYEMTLADALKLGILPSFTINHFGLPLNKEEFARYDKYSRDIKDLKQELLDLAPPNVVSGSRFFRWLHSEANRNEGQTGKLANNFLTNTIRRKQMLYSIEARSLAVEHLLEEEFSGNPESRAILFHESIKEVEKLYKRLKQSKTFKNIVTIEHSQLKQSQRNRNLERFRKGKARIIVSARSLIEGFNVPAADIGIIVASSPSVRQRIQSLGRVLRRHKGKRGEEKTSVIYVLYARETVDDIIYSKIDWQDITGVDRNVFFRWNPPQEPHVEDGPPHKPLPHDTNIDVSILKTGNEYPGLYEGREYTCDTHRNIRDLNGNFIVNPGSLPEQIIHAKGTAGRFKVTPKRKYVLVRINMGDDWKTLYVTQLEEAFSYENEQIKSSLDKDPHEWAAKANPNDEYPFKDAKILETVHFRQRRGGIISKKIKNGEAYAVADSSEEGKDVSRILEAINHIRSKGGHISKLHINEYNHAIYREAGKLKFIASIKKGINFPD